MSELNLDSPAGRWRARFGAPLTPCFPASARSRFNAKPCYLFGYGTLLTGTPEETINRLIRNALLPKCRAYIHGRLHGLGPYPGAVPVPDRSEKVFGQVFAIERSGRVLSALDAYEGYRPQHPYQSAFVRRATTAMQLSCQRPLTVWVYYYNGHPPWTSRLPSGDYLLALQRPNETGSLGVKGHRRGQLTRDRTAYGASPTANWKPSHYAPG